MTTERKEVPPQFKRSACACNSCVKFCKRQPGPLIPEDVERIRCYLQITQEQLEEKLWASPGGLVKDSGTGRVERVGTITPRWRKGQCVFLDANNRCGIWPVSPFGCAYFGHENDAVAHEKTLWFMRRIVFSEAYTQLRKRLPYATHYKPTDR